MRRRPSAVVAAPSPKIREQPQRVQEHMDDPIKNSRTPALSRRTSRRGQPDVSPSAIAHTPGRKKKVTRATKENKEEKEKDKENEMDDVVVTNELAAKEEPTKDDNEEVQLAGNGEGEPEAEAEAEEDESEDEDEEEDSEDDGRGPEILGEGFYEVEAVRKKRVRKGKLQYYIKWRDWPESANTWEPYDNVKDCEDIIEDFEKSHMTRSGRRGRGKRRFGTYLLPQKKKRTSTSNLEEGGLTATDTGEDTEGPISSEQNGRKAIAVISEGPIVSAERPTAYSSESGMISSGSKQVLVNKDMITAGVSQVAPAVASIPAEFEAEYNTSFVRPLDGNDFERSQDKLMVSADEALPKDVMVDTTSSVHELGIGPSTSTKIPQEEDMKSTSSLTGVDISKVCKEILGESSMANGHCQVKEETLFPDIGQRELSQHATGKKASGKQGSNKRVTDEDLGKLAINDKCTGAKKRKQGFVRRVRQGLDDTRQMGTEEKMDDTEQVFEDSKVANGGDSGPHEGKVPPNATDQLNQQGAHSQNCNTLAIIEIIKAVTYSSSTANGKQDVSVLFKAVRSDGQEVMVDNKFLRTNHPLLLIDFYEQHLRYSTAQ